MKKVTCSKNNLGFTLVELMVAISVLIVLTGAAIVVINPKAQRNKAEDGVRQSNLEKYALGIEAYANANGSYPGAITDSNGDNVPDDAEVRVFISKIPNDEPTVGTLYRYRRTESALNFGVSVLKASDSTLCFKYHSSWGKIKECTASTYCESYSTGDDFCNN